MAIGHKASRWSTKKLLDTMNWVPVQQLLERSAISIIHDIIHIQELKIMSFKILNNDRNNSNNPPPSTVIENTSTNREKKNSPPLADENLSINRENISFCHHWMTEIYAWIEETFLLRHRRTKKIQTTQFHWHK